MLINQLVRIHIVENVQLNMLAQLPVMTLLAYELVVGANLVNVLCHARHIICIIILYVEIPAAG